MSEEGVKYKGIDIKKIREIERIKFPHIHLSSQGKEAMEELLHADSNSLTDAQLMMKQQIEAHQKKFVDERDMFIICEIAIMYLKQCGAVKRIFNKLKEAEYNVNGCGLMAVETEHIIEIFKEEGVIS